MLKLITVFHSLQLENFHCKYQNKDYYVQQFCTIRNFPIETMMKEMYFADTETYEF